MDSSTRQTSWSRPFTAPKAGSSTGFECRRRLGATRSGIANMTVLDDNRTVMSTHPTATHEKALALNLDKSKYGTIAEIGAGQEVARWFFVVGGAAGTVAKTISAYDMAVSDAMYGPAPALRQPPAPAGHARARVQPAPRTPRRHARRRPPAFFAFADTVATRALQARRERARLDRHPVPAPARRGAIAT